MSPELGDFWNRANDNKNSRNKKKKTSLAKPYKIMKVPKSPKNKVSQSSENKVSQGSGNNEFHNPYHFVPVTKTSDKSIGIEDFDKISLGNFSHKKYSGYSGRIICKIISETPMFIGAEQSKKDENSVSEATSSLYPGTEIPMIPASSLKGMISSIAEAASNSALRVLADTPYSYRKSFNDSLSALGMVIKREEQFEILPLTLPQYSREVNNAYQNIFNDHRFHRVYIGNYNKANDTDIIDISSYRHDDPKYYYLKYVELPLKEKRGRVLGKDGSGNFPISQNKFNKLSDQEKIDYTRGIIYAFGKEGRNDIPRNKKHEYFLPYPENIKERKTIPISNDAINQFYQIADQRTDDDELFPYKPKVVPRNMSSSKSKYVRLNDGEIVYFRPNNSGTEITEISFSSIWRAAVKTNAGESASTYDFFKSIDPELLPFDSSARKKLTPAELLFGFVDEKSKSNDNDKSSLSYAGRLKFSFGYAYPTKEKYFEDKVILKTLGSPKPPSPALYFKKDIIKNSNFYISKTALCPGEHLPQGRKFYLHQKPNGKPWKTQDPDNRPNLKVKIKPWSAGLQFFFHIDFENLSEWELGLLCYSLRPTEAFRHKLGMGKPIGLGTVRIDPVGLFMIDRQKRYTEDYAQSCKRYHSIWIPNKTDISALPERYSREKSEAENNNNLDQEPNFVSFREKFRDSMDEIIKKTIEIIGNPGKVKIPVHYPQIAGLKQGTPEFERELFKWFVENDRIGAGTPNNAAALKPLSSGTDKLPTLPRLESKH